MSGPGRHAAPRRPFLTGPDLVHPAAADLFRVLAVLLVGWFHIWQQSWVGAGRLEFLPRTGYSWVDVMILLSAFCLFLPYANARAENKPFPAVGALRFYRRRVVRILPSYYGNILASLLIVLAGHPWSRRLAVDLLSHLTMTQMFFYDGYRANQLNGVTWTLTVLTLFYLVFPLLARAMYARPLLTCGGLAAVQLGWRLWLRQLWQSGRQGVYGGLFNQFPAFASTFAIGMGGAMAFAVLGRRVHRENWPLRAALSAAGLAGLCGLAQMLQRLSRSGEEQFLQLMWRTPFVLLACASLVALALGLPVPGAGLWRFLAGFSYNFYLWHQMLAVWMKYTLRIPAWSGDTPPNQLGDTAWMAEYNLQCWAAALAAAVLFTLVLERPAARWLGGKKTASRGGRFAAKAV